MANPVVQNCLLKLVECQLVYQANCLQNIESSLWLLDKCRECIDKKSLWYPKLIYYQAVEARLLGKHELYRTLAESSLRLSGQSESVLIHTWIKHNMMAVDQGWNKNKTARNYTVWNGDQTKISYYILPI
ncbi:hypothetical protein GJ496_005609 [Pomphorhynchus laevis]|nr:hypothetical protein GJ496_005609 [Pomphorhynchus laevis]